jgi:hypothetical protein
VQHSPQHSLLSTIVLQGLVPIRETRQQCTAARPDEVPEATHNLRGPPGQKRPLPSLQVTVFILIYLPLPLPHPTTVGGARSYSNVLKYKNKKYGDSGKDRALPGVWQWMKGLGGYCLARIAA